MTRHVAVDLGASSGRVAVGTVHEGRLEVEIVHRFPNGPVARHGGLFWPIDELWNEILIGLRLAGERGAVDSVGVDSWAVDYALIGPESQVGSVHHYRDPRTDGVLAGMPELFREETYEATGIQFLPFNTLYQLIAHGKTNPQELEQARGFLMVPDLFHQLLCGVASNERTNASTTQIYDPRKGIWNPIILSQAGLPWRAMPQLVSPGTQLGPLLPAVAQATGLEGAMVVAPATHDTGSAVAAVPAEGEDWAYVSSGTWSLVGVELAHPLISEAARRGNFTNEVGLAGSIRFLKNMMGLWILQECRRAWGDPSYEELYAAAAQVDDAPVFDPDDPALLAVGDDMPERVRAAIIRAGCEASTDQGGLARSILNSLAVRTAAILKQLEAVTGPSIRRVHIVGGGSQIGLLNQLIANASRREVIAGPVEATIIGNLLVQAEARGSIADGSLRAVVRRSFETRRFPPGI